MEDIVTVIESLSEMLALKPAEKAQIVDAELQLRVTFADDYKKYLAKFGAIMADGIELTGIAKSEHRDVVFVTKREWELNPKVPHNMYVVENTYVDGIIIWQDSKGIVYRTQPNASAKQIASSLTEYILNRSK